MSVQRRQENTDITEVYLVEHISNARSEDERQSCIHLINKLQIHVCVRYGEPSNSHSDRQDKQPIKLANDTHTRSCGTSGKIEFAMKLKAVIA